MLWSVDIVELNDQIADITRQDRLLTQLKQQGLVDPDLFISRRDALAEQLRAVKLEKERLLESEENTTISQTRVLLETLEVAPEFLDTFDEELFREITTLGNKVCAPEITPLVVEFKTELEKVREQVQNVE